MTDMQRVTHYIKLAKEALMEAENYNIRGRIHRYLSYRYSIEDILEKVEELLLEAENDGNE